MANIIDNFVQNFHSLEGLTIADRQKNFFKLLHNNASILKNNAEVLDALFANIHPKTYLESYFKVEFLIYFRRKHKLLETLKQGYPPFVNKIMKESWFFKESFNEVPAEKLVNDILPCMSFSVRMKVLKKLSRYNSCERFDQIFDAVVARYGIYLASEFITGCTIEKVKQILNDRPIQLTSTQLRILYMKDSQFVDFYLSRNKHLISHRPYIRIFKFIHSKDRVLFNHLKEKYDIKIKLGRRATKKYVTNKKDDIIKQPYDFHFLDMKSVIRKIGKDSVQLFVNALPANVEKCLYRDWVFRAFPRRYHYSLFVKTFQNHYKIKFEDHPRLIDESLLTILPEYAERASLAKVKVDEGLDDYLKYLLIEDSIRLIKEKINLTSSIDERARLIKQLIETCHINNNVDALLSVMKYFCFRHKNDDLSVHLQFIFNIERLFGFKKFNEEMWSTLNELLTIHMLKFDQSESTQRKVQTLPLFNFNIGTSNYQKLSYLEFLFKKNESIDELLKDYCLATIDNPSAFPKYDQFDKKFSKYFLLFVINKCSDYKDTKSGINYNCSLFEQFDLWNKCYKDDQLSFYDFPPLLNTFNHVIRNQANNYYSHTSSIFKKFRKYIFTTEENIHKNEYSQIFWDNFINMADLKDIRWFLKYEPLNIVTHFDLVFGKLLKAKPDSARPLYIWSIIKKFSHLQLDEKVVETCLTKLNDDSAIEMRPKFIPCLSVIMKPGDYAALADSYKPANKKLDLKNETEVRLYNLQCAIAENFKNTKSFEVFSSLLNYCAGDYLKYAMRSLYSLSYHTPEEMLPQYLNYLSKQAVSVRKHALYLTCELSTSTRIENMLRILNKQEAVQSLQKYMFSTTIQYFVKNPSDQFFELVKLSMLFISKADEESLSGLATHLSKMPQKYKAPYIQHSWEFLEKTVDVWKKLQMLKHGFTHKMNGDIIKELPLEFLLKIVQDHFMTEDDARNLPDMDDFTFNLLVYREEKTIVFEKIFAIVDRREKQSDIFAFLHTWYKKAMALRNMNLNFLEPFINYYASKVSLVAYFPESMNILFLRLKVETGEHTSVDKVAMSINSFLDEIIGKCGVHVIDAFASAVQSNIGYFTDVGHSIYDFYYSMIHQRRVPIVAILVLKILIEPREIYYKWTFEKILKEMKDLNDVGVDVNLFYKFGKHFTLERMAYHNSATSMEVDEQK